jgi:hypothetical protein
MAVHNTTTAAAPAIAEFLNALSMKGFTRPRDDRPVVETCQVRALQVKSGKWKVEK